MLDDLAQVFGVVLFEHKFNLLVVCVWGGGGGGQRGFNNGYQLWRLGIGEGKNERATKTGTGSVNQSYETTWGEVCS